MKKYILQPKYILGVLSIFGLGLLSTACKEDINTDNYAIAKQPTLSDYIAKTDSLSDIKQIFDRVTLGKSSNASSLTAVLSSRGHYTVFAPINSAIRAYVKKITGQEDIAKLSDEQAQLIAYNCIIDNGKDQAYETPDFPIKGTFPIANLNDRLLGCTQDSAKANMPFVINGASTIVKENINDLSNGVIHMVDAVIAPSIKNVAEMVQSADNLKIMGKLLEATGWADSLKKDRDRSYEEVDREQTIKGNPWNIGYTSLAIPQKRYLGFTAFVETDDVFQREWGISAKTQDGALTNWDDILPVLQQKAEEVYGTEAQGNLKDPNNAINRFVAYHIIPCKMPYDHLVTHFNEYKYQYKDAHNPQTTNLTVDVWDYYTTVGQHPNLLKVTQVPTGEHEIYLNRVSKYNNELAGDYKEISTLPSTTGVNIKIFAENGTNDNNALNGYYFPIDGILMNTQQTKDALSSERIRFDISSCLPELISNGFKGGQYAYFPHGYFDAISQVSEGTMIAYLHSQWNGGSAWQDYQGDEFLFSGLFDFVLKLPPVPKDGTYEIRIGVSQNSLRGMAQIYFGSDPYRLQPTGLPIDMRQSVERNKYPELDWKTDEELHMNLDAIIENDKNLRNQGFMKGPQYYQKSDGTGKSKTVRQLPDGPNYPAVRRILTIQNMKAGQSYYMRFKSALNQTNAQFFLDYFEYVPSTVYSGTEIEDVW